MQNKPNFFGGTRGFQKGGKGGGGGSDTWELFSNNTLFLPCPFPRNAKSSKGEKPSHFSRIKWNSILKESRLSNPQDYKERQRLWDSMVPEKGVARLVLVPSCQNWITLLCSSQICRALNEVTGRHETRKGQTLRDPWRKVGRVRRRTPGPRMAESSMTALVSGCKPPCNTPADDTFNHHPRHGSNFHLSAFGSHSWST